MKIQVLDGWVDDDGAVHRAGVTARLRPKELALLRYLADRPGVVVGRAELYGHVWGYHPESRSRTLDTTVRRVREVLEPDPATPRLVLTELSVGYSFAPPPEPAGDGPLSDAAARAFVAHRLATLGSAVDVPADLSPWDGIPEALDLAASRADLTGAFVPTTDDPVSRRFAALVGSDAALGAVGHLPGVPAALVLAHVDTARVRDWVDRGLARRDGGRLWVLAHAARVAPVDRDLEAALRAGAREVFAAHVHPFLGPLDRAGRDAAFALAPFVDAPWASALRGVDVPEPDDDDGLGPWARAGADPARILSRAASLAPGPRREALLRMGLRRSGRLAELPPAPSDPATGLEHGEAWYQHALGCSFAGDHAAAADAHRRALECFRGHELLEERVASGLAHSLLQLGRAAEARETFERLLRGGVTEQVEGHLGLAYCALNAGDAATALAEARRVRDRLPGMRPGERSQSSVQLMVVFREVGDLENARAAGLSALRAARDGVLPRRVEAHLQYGYGTVLLGTDEPESALPHFAEVARLAPGSDLAAAALGAGALALAFGGRDDEAAARIRRAVAECPSPPTRTTRLVRAWGARVEPLTPAEVDALLAFAAETWDPALRGVTALAAGREVPDDGTSSEVRYARWWFSGGRRPTPAGS